ncbi:MAG: hypothetical protein SVU32_03965, partial [Candidatus Nanohaloarchaea archaeon]|nr:hypothetical protein [Candidatus Nanohaloarchaea archaeon]
QLANTIQSSDRISQEALEHHAARVEELAELGMHQSLYIFTNTFFEEATREILHAREDRTYTDLSSCSAEYASQLETAASEGYIDDETYSVLDDVRDTRNDALNNDEDPDTDRINAALDLYEQTLDELGIDVDATVDAFASEDMEKRISQLKEDGMYGAAVVELYSRRCERNVQKAEEEGYDVAHERASFTGGKETIDDLAIEKEMEYLKKQFGHTLTAFEPERYERLVGEELVDGFATEIMDG